MQFKKKKVRNFLHYVMNGPLAVGIISVDESGTAKLDKAIIPLDHSLAVRLFHNHHNRSLTFLGTMYRTMGGAVTALYCMPGIRTHLRSSW